MPGPLQKPQQQWVNLDGTLGEFTAPGSAVEVFHLSTFASLADTGTGSTRLTRDLLPVRELFDVGDLNFDELLQRDLDDYRVAKEIIPYLLENVALVRFFPPILAVVVPVSNRRVIDYYPAPTTATKPGQDGWLEETTTFGGCLELTRFKASEGPGTYASAATLRFNPDQARLVVIDGQHRAMAMLAIRRHKAGDWGDKGSHFKHFYEEIADDLRSPKALEALDRIQMPVCICYFPSLFENGETKPTYTTVHCCRKLFLDVNKNAKRPTRSRQLLLDDLSLLSAFTRALLTRVRETARKATTPEIELDAFEYDSPKDLSTPVRDLAICNVQMLQQLIYWACFAQDDFYVDLNKRPQGRLADAKKERFLIETRFDKEIQSQTWRGWGYADFNKEFDPQNTSPAAQAPLADLFNKSWGDIILLLLARLLPFRAHHDAVASLRATHRDETEHGALAWRALFDGQGVLYTLEAYAEHRDYLRKSNPQLPKVRIESAYNTIRNEWIPKEFEPGRAAEYWKSVDKKKDSSNVTDSERASANRSFKIFSTQAFQIGVLMAFAYLKKQLKITEPEQFKRHVTRWIQAWNSAFAKGGLVAFDRDTNVGGFMSRYPGSLQPSDWYWFRYFTFELLSGASGDFTGKLEAQQAAEKVRGAYVDLFAGWIQSNEARQGNEISDADADERATKAWREVLKTVADLNYGDFDKWNKKRNKSKPPAKAAGDESD